MSRSEVKAKPCALKDCEQLIVLTPVLGPSKWAARKYCSTACQHLGRRIQVDLDTHLRNYEESDTGCWLWLGYIDKNGYGRVTDSGARYHGWVHRVSFRHYNGPIPEGHDIDHVCQVTRCMNPKHLEAVTKTEHAARTMRRLGKDERDLLAARMRAVGATYGEIADALRLNGRESSYAAVKAAVRKGLIDPTEVPSVRRLGEVEREEIRELFALGLSQHVLAEVYQIDASHVSRICAGFSSSHSQRSSRGVVA